VAPAQDRKTTERDRQRPELSQFEQMRLGDWVQSVDSFAWRAAEILQVSSAEEFVSEFRESLVPMVSAALRLPLLERRFSTVWPGSVRMVLPNWEPGAPTQRTWAPAMAWVLLRSLPVQRRPEEVFDRLQLRKALGAIFSTSGLEGEDNWRAAARVRVLLAYGGQPLERTVYSRTFWEDADIRWLAGVNEAGGKTYFNQEATDELLMWMMLPSLLEAADSEDTEQGLKRIESVVDEVRGTAKRSGFELEKLLTPGRESLTESVGGGASDAEDVAAQSSVKSAEGVVDEGSRRRSPGDL
jgi:hypothetical protein